MVSTFEAERRLWHHRKTPETQHVSSNAAVQTSQEHIMPVQLSPEIEGLLRSVFCTCDHNDHGTVSFAEFSSVLLNDAHVAQLLEESLGELAWHHFKDVLYQ